MNSKIDTNQATIAYLAINTVIRHNSLIFINVHVLATLHLFETLYIYMSNQFLKLKKYLCIFNNIKYKNV